MSIDIGKKWKTVSESCRTLHQFYFTELSLKLL